MFTGIIEHIGRLVGRRPQAGGLRLDIDLGPVAEGSRLGDSIAVNGICLTVDRLQDSVMSVDAGAATVADTTLGRWQVGQALNLERALALGDRLGGHMVSGHVDGTGRLEGRRRSGNSELFEFLLPASGAVRVVEKGSVAIDGVSLTARDCRGRRFTVALIPHSLAQTTLAGLRPGAAVNLEQDMIGRWVEALVGGGR